MKKGHPIKDWFINQALNHSRRTIFLSLLMTAIMGSGLTWFTVEDDILKILPKNIESRIVWDSVREEFGNMDMIFIAFGEKGESIYNPKTLAKLWDVTRNLEDIPGVEEVLSIASANRMDNIDDIMEISDLQPYRNLSEQEILDIKVFLEKSPKLERRFIGQNGDYLNIAVRLSLSAEAVRLTENVVSIGDSLLEDYELHYGGQTYLTGIVSSLIRADVSGLMQAGLLIMILVLLVNLRSFSAVGMVLSVIMLSLVFMGGFMGWVYHITGSGKFHFTVMNTSMPIILLTIANSDGVHIITKFFRVLRKQGNIRSSVQRTLDSLLMPIFLTSLTTVAAFLAMVFAPLEPLIGYGISISMGIIWAWLLSSTFLPAVISLKKWDLDSRAVNRTSIFENLIDRFGKQVLLHPKYVLAAGVFFVAVAAYGVTLLEVNVNVKNFFKKGTEIRDGMDFIDREMTGSMDIQFRLEGDLKSPQVLNSIIRIQEHVEKLPFVTTTFSITDVVKQMHRTVMDDDPAFEIIPDTRGKVNNLFTMYSMSGDPDDFETLVDYEYKTGLLTAMSRNVSTREIMETVSELDVFIAENSGPELTVLITGMMVVLRDVVSMVVKSAFISIFASLIMIGFIVAYFFKRIIWGLLAVVPLSAAIIFNFGFMGIFGMELSHVTAILSSIIIGVGVDFAVHYISQYRRMVKHGVEADILSREVVDEVGYPIILDAASNMGFGALLLSTFIPIQYIGGLMVFAMLATSLGTLTLLAALCELLKRKLALRV